MRKRYNLKILFFCLFSVLCPLFSIAEANIAIRAAVVNSSETNKRKIPFKYYLPKEIKPDNVVDMGDLDIAYDPKEGAYFVHKVFELAPKDSVLIEIELEDVWVIPNNEIKSLREEAGKVTRILANTDYYERASYLKNSIESKLTQIEHTQGAVNANPGGYISDYRDNLKLLEQVKSDLAAAKTLMAEAKNIAPMLTWKLIIVIVSFLGLLGLIFFIIWQRQIKNFSELTQDYGGSPETTPASQIPTEHGERRETTEERKSGISDIEKRLREKP